ncbi:tetratricopeptide repeat protein [Streptomyces sp. NBC_01538]|uniref:tetratricopeptide repeat protein n=1 Tax=Streptomyces sp. NBC_01538 TaxID=2903897 RepID=UPI003868F365
MAGDDGRGGDRAGLEVHNEISGGVFFNAVIQGRNIQVQLPAEVTPALCGLPHGTAAFTGREVELSILLDRLGSGAVATAVSGLAGVGKTAFAVHAARQALDDGLFSCGVLFADLHGYDEAQQVPPARVLDGWLRALGIPGEHVPPLLQDRERLYRSVLAALTKEGGRLLVVIDDARTTADVVPLLPPEGTGSAIVTSRHTLGMLEARALRLAALDEAQGTLLLERALGVIRPEDTRCADRPTDAHRVAELCGGLPLALRIVAALLADDPDRTLAVLADDLARARLAELEYGDATIRAAFDLSFRHLSAEQAEVLTLLPVVPGPDVSTDTVAILSGLDLPEARRVLESLARAHLIDQGEGRWRMHDLVRIYAAQHTGDPDEALTRLMAHYRWTVNSTLSHLEPGLTPEDRFPDRAAALAWLDAERVSLVAAIRAVPPKLLWPLPLNMGAYFSLSGHRDDWVDVCKAAVDAARLLADREGEAHALNNLGVAYREAGLLDAALDAHEQGLLIVKERGDRDTEAAILVNLGSVMRQLGRGEEAIAICREAAEVFTTVGHTRGLALAQGNLGSVLRDLGQYEEAIAILRGVAADFTRLGDLENAAIALNNLATALLDADRPGEAEEYAREAADHDRTAGARYHETEAMDTLGRALEAQGRLRDASEVHERNLELLAEFGNVRRAAEVAGHYGSVKAALKEFDEADDGYYLASKLYETLCDPAGEAAMTAELGLIRREKGEDENAVRVLQIAADLFRKVGDENGEAQVLAVLGPLENSLGRLIDAAMSFERAAELFRHLGDPRAEGTVLAALSSAQQANRLYETAFATATEALRICRETGNREGERVALNTLALALRYLKRYEESLAAHHEEISKCRDLYDQGDVADALNNLGTTLRHARRYPKSKAALEEAAELYRELGDIDKVQLVAANLVMTRRARRRLHVLVHPLMRRYALVRDVMGLKYLEKGMFDEAIRSHRISYQVWMMIGDRHAEGQAVLDLSTALLAFGEYDEAGRTAEYAAQIFRYSGHDRLELLARLNQARALTATFHSRKALPPYERALELARVLGDTRAEDIIRNEHTEALEAPDVPGVRVIRVP